MPLLPTWDLASRATPFVAEAAGQRHKQTMHVIYLGGVIHEDAELMVETKRRVRLMRVWQTDSTTPPPQRAIFFNARFMAACDTGKNAMKKSFHMFFSLQRTVERIRQGGNKGHRIFRKYGRELVSKPAISLKRSWGGYRRTTRFKRFVPELYDITAARLSLKVRLPKAEVVETLLSGCCVTWTLSATQYDETQYDEPRKAHLEVLRLVLGFQGRADHTNLSHAKALKKTKCESIETTIRKRRLFCGWGNGTAKHRAMTQSDDVCAGSRWKPTGTRWATEQLAQYPERRPRRCTIDRRRHGRFPTAVWS